MMASSVIAVKRSFFLFVWVALKLAPAHCFSAKSPQSPPPIIACKSTSEVQRAIDACIDHGDAVLELGAQLADTSAHLCRAIGANGTAVLVDVKRKETSSGRSKGRNVALFVENASAQFAGRVDYRELDQFDHWREFIRAGSQQFDALILDVGSTIGHDLYLSALAIASEFVAHQQHVRVVIVKSQVLNNLSRRIIHSQRLFDGTVELPTKEELGSYPDPLVIPCVGVNDYRKTIPMVVERGDDVIEVGCHYGTSTEILHEAAVADDCNGFCAGVDIGIKIIENAKRRYPGPSSPIFEVVDAWDTLALLKVKARHRKGSSLGYDVVYADIGGLSGAHGLLESLALLDSIGKAVEPRVIVIKSQCMKRLASRLIPFSRVKERLLHKR